MGKAKKPFGVDPVLPVDADLFTRRMCYRVEHPEGLLPWVFSRSICKTRPYLVNYVLIAKDKDTGLWNIMNFMNEAPGSNIAKMLETRMRQRYPVSSVIARPVTIITDEEYARVRLSGECQEFKSYKNCHREKRSWEREQEFTQGALSVAPGGGTLEVPGEPGPERRAIMAYTMPNFKHKKDFKAAVMRGDRVTVFQPGPMGSVPENGKITVEGPHYPEPHMWYAEVELKDGKVVKVK